MEVDREGAGDLLGALQGPGGDELGDLLGGDGAVAGADHRVSEFLDIGEQILTAAFGEDRSEHLTEQLDVIPELFGDFLPGTVTFCAYRCHGADLTEIVPGGVRAGVDLPWLCPSVNNCGPAGTIHIDSRLSGVSERLLHPGFLPDRGWTPEPHRGTPTDE
ncbi:hypothetical protein GCM10009603_15260 [Nocardiopsis exhalans]